MPMPEPEKLSRLLAVSSRTERGNADGPAPKLITLSCVDMMSALLGFLLLTEQHVMRCQDSRETRMQVKMDAREVVV